MVLDGLFEKKDISDFSKKLRNVFNLLSISRKIGISGSSALKKTRYITDYDLHEMFDKKLNTDETLNVIYQMFKDKFERCEKDPTCFITDFKCGENCDGEPLRWNKYDIRRGTKKMDNGRVVTFQECILMKCTFKLDLVKIINGVFVEFSDNYLIKLGKDANFFPHDISVPNIKNDIKHSFDDYFYTCQNLFKGLKRAFSYYLLDGKTKHKNILKKLMTFFNSNTGKLYQIRSQLQTLLLVLKNESNFRNPKISDIRNNIKLIIKKLDVPNIKQNLKLAIKTPSKTNLIKYLEDAVDELFDIINNDTAKFVMDNPDAPLY